MVACYSGAAAADGAVPARDPAARGARAAARGGVAAGAAARADGLPAVPRALAPRPAAPTVARRPHHTLDFPSTMLHVLNPTTWTATAPRVHSEIATFYRGQDDIIDERRSADFPMNCSTRTTPAGTVIRPM